MYVSCANLSHMRKSKIWSPQTNNGRMELDVENLATQHLEIAFSVSKYKCKPTDRPKKSFYKLKLSSFKHRTPKDGGKNQVPHL